VTNVAYLYDASLHEKANSAGKNYWGIYTAELFDWLGVCAAPMAPGELESAETLERTRVLVVGRDAAASLAGVAADLERWVKAGGLLIGFMPEGMEGLFGVQKRELMTQGTDPFSINGTFGWARSPLTRGLQSPLHPPEPLPVLSDRVLLCPAAGTLAASTEGPAIVYRRLGKGGTLYFAYDLAQTAWAVRQGRPVDKDYDLDGWIFRTSDGAVAGMRLLKGLVLDEALLLLERIMARHGAVSLDRLPPHDGKPSDALLFWGGDDEGLSDGSQLSASAFMKSRGLPYHINVMPRGSQGFGLSVEDANKILANGHELSVHFNFVTDWSRPDYSAEDLRGQWQMFVDRYGVRPQVYVAHCLRWCGWDETPLALEALGMSGENMRLGVPTPLGVANPCNRLGFAWGTVFPFFYRAAHQQANRRIRFLALPIQCYEVGYDAAGSRTEFTVLHAQLDLSLHYRLTTDMFFHPCTIAQPYVREAVDETLRYLRAQKANVCHSAPDALARWWMARSESKVEESREGRLRTIRVATECEEGVTLRVPSASRSRSVQVKVDGRRRRPIAGKAVAAGFLMLPLERGEHEVTITESGS